MNYLLDTAVLIWVLEGERRHLSARVLEILDSPKSAFFFSMVSIWEILIKQSLGKLKLKMPPGPELIKLLESHEVTPILLSWEHLWKLGALPQHHRDPFDRLLIAQAQVEPVVILTPDPVFSRYSIPVIW